MEGMLGTIWLIMCAMVFGGIMDAIGALARISNALLSWATSTFQLFASTGRLLFGDKSYLHQTNTYL
jgi:NhaC family Na+:H+ antiporter